MQKLVTAALALVALCACAPPPSETLDVVSDITGDSYTLDVQRPEGCVGRADCRVVYLIDSYYHFAGLSQHIERRRRRGELGDFVLVGIGYAGLDPRKLSDLMEIDDRRFYDLSWPETADGGGGGQRFDEALVTEMLPAVEEAYALEPAGRALMGHSLGGLFALTHVLLYSPSGSPFDTVVAASPSLWWDEGSLFQAEASVAANQDDLAFRLVLGAGTLEGTTMHATATLMADQLASRDYPSLELTAHYPAVGHMEAAERVFESALDELYE